MNSRSKDGCIGKSPVVRRDDRESADPLYPHGNVSAAVHGLATGPGRIGSRLCDAYTGLSLVDRSQFPPSLRDEFDWIMDRLRSVRALMVWSSGSDASVGAESGYLSVGEALGVEVARHLISLESRLELDPSMADRCVDLTGLSTIHAFDDPMAADLAGRSEVDMKLSSLFSVDSIKLNLQGGSKHEILKELVELLKLDAKSGDQLCNMLARREILGSTGIGRGVALPHCRTSIVKRLYVAFARKPEGVDFNAMDHKPVFNFFLIVAPDKEEWYLSVLSEIAQFVRDQEVQDRLATLRTPEQFLQLLADRAASNECIAVPSTPSYRG